MPRILANHPGSNPDSYPIWRGKNPFEDEQETEKLAAAIFKSRDYATYYAWTLAGLLVLQVVRYQGRKLLELLQKREHKHNKKKSLFGRLRLFHKIDQCLLYHPEGEGYMDVATHLVQLIFVAATAFLLFYNITHIIVFGFRTGFVIAINFPLLYILGAKKTPLSFLVGWSYDQLNIFHQIVGGCCVYAAIMHAAVFAYYFNPMYLITERWSLMGILAFVAFMSIGITSHPKFRESFYEIFYYVHLVGMLASLVGLYFHIHIARPFALAAGVSVIYDRVARALDGYRLARAYLELHSGDTIVVKIPKNQPRELFKTIGYFSLWNPLNVGVLLANLSIHTLNFFIGLINRQTKLKWHSGQHMFITFLRCRPFESHPFTISSSYDHEDTLEFIIRVRKGFTKSLKEQLLAHMSANGLSEADSRKISWTVILHGPYGVKPLGLFQPPAPQELAASENSCLLQQRKIVLIAGGSGVAFTFPLMLQLAHQKREVEFIWIVPDRSFATWVDLSHPRVQNASVLIHETKTQGRPDIRDMVQSRLEGSQSCDWVCVCGPDMLLRQVRNNVAELRGNGQNVELFAERFGW